MWITNTATAAGQMEKRKAQQTEGAEPEPEVGVALERREVDEDKMSFTSRLMDYVKSFFLGNTGKMTSQWHVKCPGVAFAELFYDNKDV